MDADRVWIILWIKKIPEKGLTTMQVSGVQHPAHDSNTYGPTPTLKIPAVRDAAPSATVRPPRCKFLRRPWGFGILAVRGRLWRTPFFRFQLALRSREMSWRTPFSSSSVLIVHASKHAATPSPPCLPHLLHHLSCRGSGQKNLRRRNIQGRGSSK